MKNIELQDYLQKTHKERRNLVELAEGIVKLSHSPRPINLKTKHELEFPTFNPKRLMNFKDEVNQSLQQIFKPKNSKKTTPIVARSCSRKDTYKKVYLGKSKKLHKFIKIRNTSFESHRKPIISLLPKIRIKESLLFPLSSKYNHLDKF